MTVPLPVGPWDFFASEFGNGPGHDAGAPKYTATTYNIQPDSVEADIAAGDANNILMGVNLAGSESAWTDLVNGKRIFNQPKYENQVRRFTEAGGLTHSASLALIDAIRRRRIVCLTVDEPNATRYAGSIPKELQNTLGLLFKSIWPGVVTYQRTPGSQMNPAPTGGWTGIDYGYASYAGPGSGQTQLIRDYFATQKALLAAVDLGMIPAFNWTAGGWMKDRPGFPPSCWDRDNNGTSSGYRTGDFDTGPYAQNVSVACGTLDPKCHRVTMSPALIQACADAIWDDPDAPVFWMWPHARSNFLGAFTTLEDRADFQAAFDYVITKCASRVTSTGWRAIKGGNAPPPPPPPPPSAVNYAYAEKTTRSTTTSASYVDVPSNKILSTDLVAGRQYLIYTTGQFDLNNAGHSLLVRAVHGSTAFPGSEYTWQPSSGASRLLYPFWTVWTAIAGEDVKLQMRNETGQSATLGADQVVLFALDLTSLPANSFHYAEDTGSLGLTGAYQDGASTTFTPVAGHDWLVLTLAHYSAMSITQSVFSQLARSGEAVETDPQTNMEARSITSTPILSMAKVVTCGAVSNTFKEQSKNGGGGGPRDHSKVLALDLNQFSVHQFAYTNAQLDYINDATTPWGTQAQTKSITPSTASAPCWALAVHNFVPLSGNIAVQSRLQIDNADAPATQTTDSYVFMTDADVTDIVPIHHQVVAVLSNVAHAVDLDAALHAATGAGRGGRQRLVAVIQLSATSTPPTWTPIADKSIDAETLLDFVVVASDAVVSEPNLIYSVVGTLPNGANFDVLTRRFRWTPRPLQIDPETPYPITLRVSNGTTSADITFNVTVTGVQAVETPFDSVRNLRYDASLQAGRIMLSVSWDTGGTLLAGILKHGITGIVVEMTDMNRNH